MVNVAQGNRGLTHRLIQKPSQYRAFTPSAPPNDNTATLTHDSTRHHPFSGLDCPMSPGSTPAKTRRLDNSDKTRPMPTAFP